jgi:hypothetical protein
MLQRLLPALPYFIILLLSVAFYFFALDISYTARGENLGPDFWPRVVLSVAIVICVVQLARQLLSGHVDNKPVIGNVLEQDGDEQDAPRSNLLLIVGMALTMAYGVMVTFLGFLIATALFIVLFIYAGRYRAHGVIWLSGVFGAVLLTVLFQRVVYVSLPRGIPPFDQVADRLLALF